MGTKVVVMALASECLSYFETNSLQVARDQLQCLTASKLPDEMSHLVEVCAFPRPGIF